MKRCQVCGTDILENEKICPICGSEIDEEYVDLYRVYKDAVQLSLNKESESEIVFKKDAPIEKEKSLEKMFTKTKYESDSTIIKKRK